MKRAGSTSSASHKYIKAVAESASESSYGKGSNDGSLSPRTSIKNERKSSNGSRKSKEVLKKAKTTKLVYND